jgi:hypothetical protein
VKKALYNLIKYLDKSHLLGLGQCGTLNFILTPPPHQTVMQVPGLNHGWLIPWIDFAKSQRPNENKQS